MGGWLLMLEGVDPLSVQVAVEEVRRGFRVDDHVTLTTLRRSPWLGLLRERGKLQLTDHSETVGVVVSPETWRQVEVLADTVRSLLDQLEAQEVERLWSDRLIHARKPADLEGPRLLALLEQDDAR